jgi:hypothetical protein
MPGFLGGSSGSGVGGEIRFPAELIDPVTKLRVSEPQTLIDTDFEYGLQPTKWETVELINNTPSFFSKSGDTTIPNIEAITTTATSREIKVTTSLAHGLAVGIPINVSGTKSLTADGSYIINSVPTPTTFTYLCKQNQPDAASIEDLYTSIITGEFFQGSQIKIADSDGIVTDAQGASTLTVKTESPHGFGLNTPFYFLNLNSTVSQEFDSSNTSSKAFDAANSSTAQVFDGSNTLTSYRLDLDNNAVAAGVVSSISTYNPTTNQITVAHTTENFVGLSIGSPLYHNITTAGGYFASNPRGVVFLKSLDTSNVNGSIFTVSEVPNGSVIPVPNALTGTFQKANEARLFAGNNINSATEISINLVEEAEKTFNGTNTGGQFLNNCSFSGSNVTGASGSGVADLDLYQGLMVKYETTGTPPTINAGGDASNGGSTTSLVNGRTYFIESSFQVGSSINYVTTLKEFPTSASNINFTSTGSGTHTFTVIGIATDKDIIHLKNHGYVIGDMLRYTYPSGARFAVNTPATEEKDYYFVERLFGTHNFQLNFTIGELTPKLQEFIGLTASSSSVNVTFTASGFTAPLTWSVTSGTLPSGLSLNTSTGAITGTPNAAYTQATVRITVTDAAASSDFADVTFQVNPPPFLYDQVSVTFTPGGATGANGPSLAQARSGAGNPSWGSSYINTSNGIILWTVGRTGTYNFTLAGARGGRNSGNGQQGGQGAVGSVNGVSLTQGEVLRIVVGQVGSNGPGSTGEESGGGGGATYVQRNGQSSPIAVVGGGGGGSANQTGMSISSDNRGLAARLVNTTDSSGGYGAYAQYVNGTHEGGGGAGWTGNGIWWVGGITTNRLGKALNNTAQGGVSGDGGGQGGFGGGGQGGRNNGAAGGGGGYRGGWGGVYSDPGQGSSGTGGQSGSGGWGFGISSYSGYNNGDGYVTVTRV